MEKDIIIKTREKIISSFNDLEFVEGPHKYYRHLPDGSKDEYTPVSYIIRRWFDEFDADSESARYAVKIGSTQEEAESLILESLKIGVVNNARKWKYSEAILKDWESHAVTNLELVNESKNKKGAERRDTGEYDNLF